MAEHKLDVRGEICPYTLISTRRLMEELEAGDVVEVLIDYPLAAENIPRWAEKAGHRVLEVEKVGDSQWRLLIRKGG